MVTYVINELGAHFAMRFVLRKVISKAGIIDDMHDIDHAYAFDPRDLLFQDLVVSQVSKTKERLLWETYPS
jgi:hypothetical protein